MRLKAVMGFMMVLVVAGVAVAAAADVDDLYQESFQVPEQSHAKATIDESVFRIATVTNTATTGHGNVQFKVMWNGDTNRYQLLIWSYDSYYGCTGYRQWFDAPTSTYFAAWPRRGGALCVGWPPTYTGMNSSMQLLDVDGDGDLDVFHLTEIAPEEWTVYLYQNLN